MCFGREGETIDGVSNFSLTESRIIYIFLLTATIVLPTCYHLEKIAVMLFNTAAAVLCNDCSPLESSFLPDSSEIGRR